VSLCVYFTELQHVQYGGKTPPNTLSKEQARCTNTILLSLVYWICFSECGFITLLYTTSRLGANILLPTGEANKPTWGSDVSAP
jgi:hypothetical protein